MAFKYTNRIIMAFILIFSMVVQLLPAQKVSALSGNEFMPGRIIDDLRFFSGPTMSVTEIQTFLNSKVPNCDTWGTQPYNETTRAAYAASKGISTPFTCLKNYGEVTPAKNAEPFLCNGYSGGFRSASDIIYQVSQICGVSVQALIVTLQKEQALITDDWPWPVQYRSAMGYGCPDTAPCDSEYYGFFNQVYNAARQFKRYKKDPQLFNYKSGYTNYIQYNPNINCGGSNVVIQNQATAGLYNYTPYQPNPAALNNLYGTGDSCSAYGNRNFWRIHQDWFGTTYSNDSSIAHPNGTLVSDGSRIFFTDNSTRRYIKNVSVFESHGYRWDQVKKATSGDLNLPIGAPLENLASGTLFRTNNSPVYIMDYDNGNLKKRHISFEAFNALGYRWEDVMYVPPNEVPSETFSTILYELRHPVGSLVFDPQDYKTYWIGLGNRMHVASSLAFDTNYFKWSNVKNISAIDRGLPIGPTLDIRQGSMLLTSNGIFLVDYDQNGITKRPVGPWECYADRMHYSSKDWYGVIPINSAPPRTGPIFTC